MYRALAPTDTKFSLVPQPVVELFFGQGVDVETIVSDVEGLEHAVASLRGSVALSELQVDWTTFSGNSWLNEEGSRLARELTGWDNAHRMLVDQSSNDKPRSKLQAILDEAQTAVEGRLTPEGICVVYSCSRRDRESVNDTYATSSSS